MKKLFTFAFGISFVCYFLCGYGIAGGLTKDTVIDRIEVIDNGCVQVREAIQIAEDGKIIGQEFHRYVVAPGDDYSKRDAKVKAICATIHTQAVIDAFIKANELALNPPEPVNHPGLSKEIVISKIYILRDETVIPIQTVKIYENSKMVGASIKTLAKIKPGDDYSMSNKRVRDICDTLKILKE